MAKILYAGYISLSLAIFGAIHC